MADGAYTGWETRQRSTNSGTGGIIVDLPLPRASVEGRRDARHDPLD